MFNILNMHETFSSFISISSVGELKEFGIDLKSYQTCIYKNSM